MHRKLLSIVLTLLFLPSLAPSDAGCPSTTDVIEINNEDAIIRTPIAIRSHITEYTENLFCAGIEARKNTQYKKAYDLFTRATIDGHEGAMYSVFSLLLRKKVEVTEARRLQALFYAQILALKQSALGYYMMGICCDRGAFCVSKNKFVARQFFQCVVQSEHVSAAFKRSAQEKIKKLSAKPDGPLRLFKFTSPIKALREGEQDLERGRYGCAFFAFLYAAQFQTSGWKSWGPIAASALALIIETQDSHLPFSFKDVTEKHSFACKWLEESLPVE